MPDTNPYFQIQHQGERIELRPSASQIQNKVQPAGCLWLFLIPVLFFNWWNGEETLTSVWIFGACILPIWLIAIYGNRRFRRQATVPLIIAPGPYILHGDKLLSSGIKFNSVQLAVKENYDDPDSYNVQLVPASGEPVTLPLPYFGDLSFYAAELLANEVAVLLRIPFERTLMPPE